MKKLCSAICRYYEYYLIIMTYEQFLVENVLTFLLASKQVLLLETKGDRHIQFKEGDTWFLQGQS